MPLIIDIETTGLDPLVDQVVAIGIIDTATDNFETTFISRDEKQLLKDFWEYLSSGEPGAIPILVGYNINDFDIWFLKMRSLKHSVKIETRFETVDLMKVLFANQRFRSLNDVCVNILGAKKNGHGSEVPELFRAGEFEKIETYLSNDLRITKQLFDRMYYCLLK